MRRFRYLVYPLTILAVLACSYWGSRAVSTLAETGPIGRQQRILIDAGHGVWTVVPYPAPESRKAATIWKLLCV